MMGLRTCVYWGSWIGFAQMQMTVLVFIFTVILCGGGVLQYSNPLCIFLFFWLYSLSTVSFAMLVSSFFSRAKVAAACGGLFYYIIYLPYSLYNKFEDVVGFHTKNLFCL